MRYTKDIFLKKYPLKKDVLVDVTCKDLAYYDQEHIIFNSHGKMTGRWLVKIKRTNPH